ncbi:MAG: outer membrane protein assembly factor BamD [Verrucomicrobiae bacterium]|nr:outer membrane protein assembly factor BamD [Verrucomicrobiae bacterium]
MQGRFISGILLATALVTFSFTCPAPVIFRPGEGWTYEPVGGGSGKWQRKRAKDQLQVAQEAFDRGNYRLATKAASRVVSVWPLSDYAGPAQYLVGRCYEDRGMDERAFKAYQIALTKYPKVANYDEILGRQYAIATRFLDGQRFKLFGYIPLFRSMEKTAKMMQEIVGNGPYNSTGPKAQLDTGTAFEKQKKYTMAVQAYEKAANRYFDRPPVASDAIFRAATAWEKQALTAEYDQSKAGSAIALMQDFIELYPQDPRVPEARDIIATLRVEQARGAFETGRFYERYRRWQAALVYYNESLQRDANSPYAEESRRRIELLRPLAETQVQRIADYELRVRQRATARATNAPAVIPATGAPTNAPAATP